MSKIIFALFICLNSVGFGAQNLVTYDPPKEIIYKEHNDDFTVKVRNPGGEWKDLFEYNVQVDLDKVQDASMVYFDFSGNVEVAVKVNNMDVHSVAIRPLSSGIKPEVKNNVITFSLQKASKLSVEINGDRLHNLHVFANPMLEFKPDSTNPDLIYFGPGVHQPVDQPGNVFNIPSGKTVFIHGSAILKGKLVCNKVSNVRIIGRGIIDQPERGVEITYSDNIGIDGIIFKNPKHYTVYGGQSNNLVIRNIKSFSCRGWSDGIDLMSCSDVEIDDVFMRNSDDCIAIYTHRWDYYGNARNYKITNSILWADVAHPTNIGLHGNGLLSGDTIENILFSNIDILEHDEDDRNYQGCLAISAGDNNLVRNITYEDIRVDHIQEGQLFNFRVYYNNKYCTAPGMGIQNVYLKNISYNDTWVTPSFIAGYDKTRLVEHVTIEKLFINGKEVQSLDGPEIIIGDHVKKVEFIK